MKIRPHSIAAAALVTTLSGVAVAGCAATESRKAESPTGGATPITVDATDSACELSATTADKGKHTFVVTNNGSKVTEFYVYGPDKQVLAEVENISPGLKRTLDVDFSGPGTYRTACKPGMVGDGISAELTVRG